MGVSKSSVEQQLGFEITVEQFEESKRRAELKLSSIITRFGDADGARQDPDYLIELIYEDVIMDIFSKATVFVAVNVLNMEKEHSANCQSALID